MQLDNALKMSAQHMKAALCYTAGLPLLPGN